MTPRILAIIVTYNGAKWLREAVKSLGGSTVRPDVIAIDNGSTDGSQEILAGLGVETVQMSANVGFGAANNVGLQRAVEGGYDFAYLLNQDARVDEKCLETLAAAMTAEPRFGIASPLQFDGTGESLDLQFARRCAGRLEGATGSIVEVPFVMAAHWMISRSCLLAVGGFSPVFSQYGEDDNYIDRAHYHGFRVGVVPAAKAIHDRAQRPNPKERRMYLKCTAALAKVSDPNRPLALSLVSAPLELLAMGMYHCSLTPIRYIPTLLRRYPELIKYRKLSTRTAGSEGDPGPCASGGLKPFCSGRKHKNACCEHPRDLGIIRGGTAGAAGGGVERSETGIGSPSEPGWGVKLSKNVSDNQG